MLRSVSVFETLYLSRSTSRMTEAVSSALSQYSNSRGTAPGASDGVTVARIITNELDSAKFDPLLVRTVARNASRVLNNFISRIDNMASRSCVVLICTLTEADRPRFYRQLSHRSICDSCTGYQHSSCQLPVSPMVQPQLHRARFPGQSMGNTEPIRQCSSFLAR